MRMTLALGSGGARGFSHIGVVREIRDRGYHIAAVLGTSMGSVVGGLEAAGRLDRFTEWVTSIRQRDIWRLIDPAFTDPGVIWAQRVTEHIAEMLAGVRIEELPIPFTAVPTDLTNAREVWFKRGAVATAIRASIGIPSIFTPVVIADRLLADGGLLNPVPVDAPLGICRCAYATKHARLRATRSGRRWWSHRSSPTLPPDERTPLPAADSDPEASSEASRVWCTLRYV